VSGSLTYHRYNPINGSYEHHDFDFMGAILPRMTTGNGVAECPQSADISPNIRRLSFGTLRVHNSCRSDAIAKQLLCVLRDIHEVDTAIDVEGPPAILDYDP